MSRISLHKFEGAIQQNDRPKISRYIHDGFGRHGITLDKLKHLAQQKNYAPLKTAIQSVEKMRTLQGTGLSEREFLEIAFFIEARLAEHIRQHGSDSLKQNQTG